MSGNLQVGRGGAAVPQRPVGRTLGPRYPNLWELGHTGPEVPVPDGVLKAHSVRLVSLSQTGTLPTPKMVLGDNQKQDVLNFVENFTYPLADGFASKFCEHGVIRQTDYDQLKTSDKELLRIMYAKKFGQLLGDIDKPGENRLAALNEVNKLLRNPNVPQYIRHELEEQVNKRGLVKKVINETQKEVKGLLSKEHASFPENVALAAWKIGELENCLGGAIGHARWNQGDGKIRMGERNAQSLLVCQYRGADSKDASMYRLTAAGRQFTKLQKDVETRVKELRNDKNGIYKDAFQAIGKLERGEGIKDDEILTLEKFIQVELLMKLYVSDHSVSPSIERLLAYRPTLFNDRRLEPLFHMYRAKNIREGMVQARLAYQAEAGLREAINLHKWDPSSKHAMALIKAYQQYMPFIGKEIKGYSPVGFSGQKMGQTKMTAKNYIKHFKTEVRGQPTAYTQYSAAAVARHLFCNPNGNVQEVFNVQKGLNDAINDPKKLKQLLGQLEMILQNPAVSDAKKTVIRNIISDNLGPYFQKQAANLGDQLRADFTYAKFVEVAGKWAENKRVARALGNANLVKYVDQQSEQLGAWLRSEDMKDKPSSAPFEKMVRGVEKLTSAEKKQLLAYLKNEMLITLDAPPNQRFPISRLVEAVRVYNVELITSDPTLKRLFVAYLQNIPKGPAYLYHKAIQAEFRLKQLRALRAPGESNPQLEQEIRNAKLNLMHYLKRLYEKPLSYNNTLSRVLANIYGENSHLWPVAEWATLYNNNLNFRIFDPMKRPLPNRGIVMVRSYGQVPSPANALGDGADGAVGGGEVGKAQGYQPIPVGSGGPAAIYGNVPPPRRNDAAQGGGADGTASDPIYEEAPSGFQSRTNDSIYLDLGSSSQGSSAGDVDLSYRNSGEGRDTSDPYGQLPSSPYQSEERWIDKVS